MFSEPVVFVDIETTGGSYRTSQIIEFAAIRVENGEITEKFSTLINPGSPIPGHITRLTGITTANVEYAPYFVEVAEQIHSIMNGAIFIAHHVRFDYSFLKRQLGVCNINFNPRMLCSVRISRALYPLDKGHGLEAIIKRFNIQTVNRHRAYDDAEAIWKFLQIAFKEHGSEKFEQAVNKQLKTRTLPPNLDVSAFNSLPNSVGVYTFLDSRGAPIYIGKSVSIRKRVMSHFAQDTEIDKEMKLSLRTHSITHIETASELEALLLESRMVKERLPLYNQQLRRIRKMYALRTVTNSDGFRSIEIDYVNHEDISPDKSIYGVYSSKMKARRSLEDIQKTYDLCPKLLGIEKASRECFKYQLGKCKGACNSHEAPDGYNLRFEIAFEKTKLDKWPYSSPIIISHINVPGEEKTLVIDNWNVIGELKSQEGCDPHYKAWKSAFDIDTYRIIKSYVQRKSGNIKLQPISYGELESMTS
jgi:DNA polymerase III subunit epsilon